MLMVVTLAAARRLCAIHHGLEPARHVHLQHLITSDKTVLLQEGGQRHSADSFHLIEESFLTSVCLTAIRAGFLPAADGILAFSCDPW